MDQTILIQLAQETRSDVKKLLEGMAGLEQRVRHLERLRPSKIHKAGIATAGAGALVVAVLQGLQAAGWIRVPVASAAPPPALIADHGPGGR